MISIPITRQFLTHPISRPALRDRDGFRLREVRAIVMHWTANTDKGAHAMANRNYFNLGSRYASAHYVVDDHSIIQCLPDNEVAYHVGAKRYEPAGRALMAGTGLNPNYYTLGIEMCVNKDGDWEKTYRYAAELAAFLLLKYSPPEPTLLRHFDITGKDCPKMMITPEPWQAFRNLVDTLINEMKQAIRWRATCITEGLNVRSGPGMEHPASGQLYLGEPVLVVEESGNWCQIDTGGWVHGDFLAITA
jgi:N-acetylmuramoyl-L-alanine amidase